jgi:hypothetical protein
MPLQFRCFASVFALVSAGLSTCAVGQFNLTGGTVSGFAGGTATPIAGGPTIQSVPDNSPFTLSADKSSGSGSTSGGLGSGNIIGTASVVFNVSTTTALARAGNVFSLRISAVGSAQFDEANYTGGIGANAGLDTLFFALQGSSPMPFTFEATGGWTGLPLSSFLQFNGAPFTGTELSPGNYFLSTPFVVMYKGTEDTDVPSFAGELRLTIPSPGAASLMAAAAGIVLLRRKPRGGGVAS